MICPRDIAETGTFEEGEEETGAEPSNDGTTTGQIFLKPGPIMTVLSPLLLSNRFQRRDLTSFTSENSFLNLAR